MERENFNSGNTRVYQDSEGATILALHGNPIARRSGTSIQITTAGWNTLTTRERLNGLPGVRVYSKRGQLHLNGNPWDGSWIEVADVAHRPVSIKVGTAECTLHGSAGWVVTKEGLPLNEEENAIFKGEGA